MKIKASIILFLAFTANSFAQSINSDNKTWQIDISSTKELNDIKVLYDFPNLLYPNIYYRNDTLDISQYVKITPRNRYILGKTENHPENYIHSKKVVNINNHISFNGYIICLSDEVYGKDVLIWKKKDQGYSLIAIYPSEVGICLYCNPDFYTSNVDTFSIGSINHEEGDVYGGYNYYTIENDTLHLAKEVVAHGTCPFQEGGNPVDSATCISYITVTYDNNGIETSSIKSYKCQDGKGEDIYAHAAGDSISLYKDGYWGREYINVRPDSTRFRIGLSVFLGGVSYIDVEYRGRWYLTPRSQIVIEE
jgi:hypothetical protein